MQIALRGDQGGRRVEGALAHAQVGGGGAALRRDAGRVQPARPPAAEMGRHGDDLGEGDDAGAAHPRDPHGEDAVADDRARRGEHPVVDRRRRVPGRVRRATRPLCGPRARRARVRAAQKARDLAEKTFEITQKEQALGAKSSYDTLVAQHELAVAESALTNAETAYAKAQVDIDRATGDTLQQAGIAIDEAKTGVVHNVQP